MNGLRCGSGLPLCGCSAAAGQLRRLQLQPELARAVVHGSVPGAIAVGCETSTRVARSDHNAAGARIDAESEAW